MKAAFIVLALCACTQAGPGFVTTYNGALPGPYNPLTYGQYGYSYQTAHAVAPVTYAAAAPAVSTAYAAYQPAVTYAAPAVAPVTYAAAAPVAVPVGTKTQYHAQDVLGQASYGYSYPGQAAHAVRDAAGNVRGSYAYINPDGNEIRVNYVADQGGFRAESNALPQAPVHVIPSAVAAPVAIPAAHVGIPETPEVVEARRAHEAAHVQARARNLLFRKKRGIVAAPVVTYAAGAYPAATALTYGAVHHPTAYGYGYSTAVHHPTAFGYGYSTAVHHPTAYAAVAPVSTYAHVLNNPAVAYSVY